MKFLVCFEPQVLGAYESRFGVASFDPRFSIAIEVSEAMRMKRCIV